MGMRGTGAGDTAERRPHPSRLLAGSQLASLRPHCGLGPSAASPGLRETGNCVHASVPSPHGGQTWRVPQSVEADDCKLLMREAPGCPPWRLRETLLNNRANSVATSHPYHFLHVPRCMEHGVVQTRGSPENTSRNLGAGRRGRERRGPNARVPEPHVWFSHSPPPRREAPWAEGGRLPTPGAWRAGALEVVHQVDAGASVLARLVLALVHLVLAVDALVARDALPGASERARVTLLPWRWRQGARRGEGWGRAAPTPPAPPGGRRPRPLPAPRAAFEGRQGLGAEGAFQK